MVQAMILHHLKRQLRAPYDQSDDPNVFEDNVMKVACFANGTAILLSSVSSKRRRDELWWALEALHDLPL